MTRVFMVKDSGERQYSWTWWCDTCIAIAKKQILGRGNDETLGAWPEPTPDPVICPKCSGPARFSSCGSSAIFIREDTGEEILKLSDHPGACYEEKLPYYDRQTRQPRTGPDGRVLTVICPNGQSWTIDSRAGNCTNPTDNIHRCWVRHGSPEAGDLTVDKQGKTCLAGAGSIVAGDYHGFLRHGRFEPC